MYNNRKKPTLWAKQKYLWNMKYNILKIYPPSPSLATFRVPKHSHIVAKFSPQWSRGNNTATMTKNKNRFEAGGKINENTIWQNNKKKKQSSRKLFSSRGDKGCSFITWKLFIIYSIVERDYKNKTANARLLQEHQEVRAARQVVK